MRSLLLVISLFISNSLFAEGLTLHYKVTGFGAGETKQDFALTMFYLNDRKVMRWDMQLAGMKMQSDMIFRLDKERFDNVVYTGGAAPMHTISDFSNIIMVDGLHNPNLKVTVTDEYAKLGGMRARKYIFNDNGVVSDSWLITEHSLPAVGEYNKLFFDKTRKPGAMKKWPYAFNAIPARMVQSHNGSQFRIDLTKIETGPLDASLFEVPENATSMDIMKKKMSLSGIIGDAFKNQGQRPPSNERPIEEPVQEPVEGTVKNQPKHDGPNYLEKKTSQLVQRRKRRAANRVDRRIDRSMDKVVDKTIGKAFKRFGF